MDNETASPIKVSDGMMSFPHSYVANRGTYRPPSEFSAVPSAGLDEENFRLPNNYSNTNTNSNNVSVSSSTTTTGGPSYEFFARNQGAFRRDSEDEETVTF